MYYFAIRIPSLSSPVNPSPAHHRHRYHLGFLKRLHIHMLHDADLGFDVDDVGAIAIGNHLHDKGEVLLSVLTSTPVSRRRRPTS